MPRTPKSAPTISNGHLTPPDSSGTTRPMPTHTASDVRPVRHQARYVRSFARRVRLVASSTPGSSTPERLRARGSMCMGECACACALGRVRGVAELAELAGDEVRDLLADVDRVVADPLDTTRDDEHAQAVLALRSGVAEREHVVGRVAVRAVDQIVEVDERRRLVGVALAEGVQSHADHLLAALAHVLDRAADVLV